MTDDLYLFDPITPSAFGVMVIHTIDRNVLKQLHEKLGELKMANTKKTVKKAKTAAKAIKQGTKGDKRKTAMKRTTKK